MKKVCALLGFAIAVLISVAALLAAQPPVQYDVVILHGRVMDPETGLDGVRNVGVCAGKICAIGAQAMSGKKTIDAQGLVVAPGFIDPHEHGQKDENYRYQARDGVTTSLELEAGTDDVATWYAERSGKALINYGVSVGHIPVRARVMAKVKLDISDPVTMKESAAAAHRIATPEELAEMEKMIDLGMQQGALAEGMGINYTPGASRQEIVAMFREAAKYGASVHVHLRYAGVQEPESGISALEEVIAAAAVTGAPLHVVHISSMGLASTPDLIAMVAEARRHGMDVTAEAYPYTAASTALESAVFDPGWQQKMAIGYHDLQWAATGERLTAETFERYRKQGGIVVIYAIPESAARAAMVSPLVMIGSDGMPITGAKVHPRGQGSFSRVLGHYVREEHALPLMEALRKMTLMPAQRLERRAPVFANKGRIRVGADADITIFDADHIIDKASFESPLQYSDGVEFVLVNGVPVVDQGKLVEGVFPGQAARAPLSH